MTSALKRLLAQRPFKPLTIYLSDGGHYVIEKPQEVEAGFETLTIQYEEFGRGVRVEVAVRHITRIEVKEPKKPT
jgi:hypothetical protein